MSWLRRVPRMVLCLGVVSLLTDLSSEMIYPLLPVFLTTALGAGPAALGVIEGVAESTAAVLKVVSGAWSDRLRRRKPLIVAGYGLASLARPLICVAATWPQVLSLRFTDRVGKGIRTSPRDALISDATPAEVLGAAYGVHRAMDHLGAILGPLVAAALLSVPGITLRHVFLLTAIPGSAVLLVLLLAVREPPRPPRPTGSAVSGDLGPAARHLRPFLVATAVFTLGNSTDAFLLLRLGKAGFSAAWIAMLWAALHMVKLVFSLVGGRLSDRFGRRGLMLAGWLVYAAVYAAFATVRRPVWFVIVFLCYGLYFGLTEPVEKAWVSDLVPASARGSAFGLYHATVGLTALPASILFGLLWRLSGAPTAFATGAILALFAALLLVRVPVQGAADLA